jgi:putative aldouronate transport system permease protein
MNTEIVHKRILKTRNQPIRKFFNALRRYKMLYILLIPGLLYFSIFKYVPMAGIMIAFKDYNLALGIWDSPWAGFKNFNAFFQGVYFWDIMGNTILISLYKLVFGFPAPIILALLLNEVRINSFKRFVQTITYMPHFLSWVIVYGLLVALLSPGGGFVNLLFKQYGFEPIAFLSEPGWARFLVVSSDVWKEMGWGAILYLAALAGIDPSLYEAARIDGASK